MRRLLGGKRGLPTTLLFTVLILLLCLTPRAIYAFSNGLVCDYGCPAITVIGQPNFTSRLFLTTQSSIWYPLSVAFDNSGNLWAPDRYNNRVLEFLPPFSNGMNAALVIGQSSFTTNTAATTQNGLNGPYGVAFDSPGNLWLADSSNSRVLEFSPPFTTDEAASAVVGQTSFTAGGAATTQYGLQVPAGIGFDSSDNLWVADQENSRVLEFQGMPPPTTITVTVTVTSTTTVTTTTNLNCPAANVNLQGANLKGANFEDCNLAARNLSGSNLQDANFLGANLQGANLQGSNLQGDNFQGANLVGANLQGANLQGANMNNANLTNANLTGANLQAANMNGANLTDANFTGANCQLSTDTGATTTGVITTGSNSCP